MITLNLIAPSYKKIIKTKHSLSIAQNILFGIALMVILIGIVLLTAQEILSDNFIRSTEHSLLVSQTPKNNREISKINKKITLASNAQKEYIPWSHLLIYLSNIVPNNIRFNSINILPDKNQDTWNISISGIANDRDAFLTLKENLIKTTSKIFENLDIPLSNLFQKENIPINITFQIKKENLINLSLNQ